MGRKYAGILGLLAFLATVARGFVCGGAAEPTLFAAWLGLVALSAVGFLAGSLGEWIVEDSVRSRIAMEVNGKQETPAARSGHGTT